MMADKAGAGIVIGGGVGGIRAALDLAESGYHAYLVDSNPTIGGTVPRLDKWFPDNQCEMCKLLPVFDRDDCAQLCLRRDLGHRNVELISNSHVEKLTGEAGNFKVTVATPSWWVKPERCTGCGLCAEVCPVETPNEYEDGLVVRKAVFVSSPQSIPNVYCIDREACTRCGKCIEVCPTDAIDLDLPDESREIEAGAIIVSTGFSEFDAATMGQYGFGRHVNVLTNLQAERLLSATGHTEGRLLRPSDGREPERVALLQCVGSRDAARDYCSTACCMYALKEAILIKQKRPETEVTIYYMDIRAFGKGYHQYYVKAQELGMNFARCRVSTVRENPNSFDLKLMARSDDGSDISAECDLVILSAAQCPSARAGELAETLGVTTNAWGFIQGQAPWTTRTNKEGIFVCGSATAPADISDTVIQASAAAVEAVACLGAPSRVQGDAGTAVTAATAADAVASAAVFICRCGQEIASVVDTARVAEMVGGLPAVTHVEEVDFLCLPETLEKVGEAVAKAETNRVVLAACTPYRYQRLFGETMTEAGIDPSWWQLVNIREQLAWVHRDQPEAATEKAERVIAVSAERLASQEQLTMTASPVEKRALVIGGGVSGMVAASSLADQGFETHLVEKTAELGGHAAGVCYSLGFENPQEFIDRLRGTVTSSKLIEVHTETEVSDVTGHAGAFRSTLLATDGTESQFEHCALVIATGAADYPPSEYGYGNSQRVITQRELQQRLTDEGLEKSATVVMIQCVGSRDEEHPYCNRSCCSEAIANALEIKKQSPETDVFVLNRDIMTYSFREAAYTRARDAGVLFVRYEEDDKPEVSAGGDSVTVRVNDPVLGGRLDIEADLLVLSTGIVAGDNAGLAGLLKLDLTEDGFFKEVDTKFRPVDTVIDGVFVCGRANAPRNLDEEIVMAQAAAQRAANVLSRPELSSGAVVSEVNARRCSGCQICVTTCPFKARSMDDDQRIAVVEEALCQACGSCVAACPNSAARLRGYQDKQMLSAILTAL